MSFSTIPWVTPTKPNALTSAATRHGPTGMTAHDKLVAQARKWVAMTFYDPMFKQMREDPFHSDLFDGGRGGQAFEAMYDQALSERMSGPASNGLVQAIVSRIEARKAYAEQMRFKPNSEREGADRIPNAPAADIFARGSYGEVNVTPNR